MRYVLASLVAASVVTLVACGGSSSQNLEPDGPAKVDGAVSGGGVDAPAKPDGAAGTPDGAAAKPDGAAGAPDGSTPKPDGAPTNPDAAVVIPDAAPSVPDSPIDMTPDAAIDMTPDGPIDMTPDAAIDMTPDAAAGHPDSKPANPDSKPPTPDSKPPAPDAMVDPCGNGQLDPGEKCDTGIVAGNGACPASCDDGIECTSDVLVNPGTCQAECTFTAVTPTNGDGLCCAPATAENDNDCSLTAYRFTTLKLIDPHAWHGDTLCLDYTSLLNTYISGQLTNTTGGNYNLSPLLVFDPLRQADGDETTVDFLFGTCSSPGNDCTPDGTPVALDSTAKGTGTCLDAIAGTLSDPEYSPSVTATTGPCFSTAAKDVDISFGALTVHLQDARIAAKFTGDPATGMTTGLIYGFLTKAEADAVTVPLLGGMLNEYLSGDAANCKTGDVEHGDDRDQGGTGWYVYASFTATKVTYTP
jgi:hypothetical protein